MAIYGIDLEFFKGHSKGVLIGDMILVSDVNVFNCDLDIVDDFHDHLPEISLFLLFLLGKLGFFGEVLDNGITKIL